MALAKRVLQLEKQLVNKYSFEGILGKSKQVKAAIEAATKVADTNKPMSRTAIEMIAEKK